MCQQCHNALSKDAIKQQILDALENPRFESWNTISINHLFLSLMGQDGYEISELAHRLLKNYISWARDHLTLSVDNFNQSVDIISAGVQSLKNSGLAEEQLKEWAQSALS